MRLENTWREPQIATVNQIHQIDHSLVHYAFQIDTDWQFLLPGLWSPGMFQMYYCSVDLSANDVGQLYYRITNESAILDEASNAVAGYSFSAIYAVIITWHKVTHVGGSNATAVSLLL